MKRVRLIQRQNTFVMSGVNRKAHDPDRMEGIKRVYDTGISYAKRRYLPNTLGSVLYILLYTVLVFALTEYLMRGVITRWLYIGSVIMVVSMVYSGVITANHV